MVAQYWLYWVFNQWNDVHESDWEMAQVMIHGLVGRAGAATQPTMYAYAQHEGSQYADPGEDGDKVFSRRHPPDRLLGRGLARLVFESGLWFGKSGGHRLRLRRHDRYRSRSSSPS